MRIRRIPLNEITVPSARKEELSGRLLGIGTLAQSMKDRGQLCPIGVSRKKRGRPFLLVFGLSRFEAAKDLKWERIDAVVIKPPSRREAIIHNAVESVQRAPVPPLEIAELFQRLRKTMSTKQIADRCGLSVKKVCSYLRLAREPK